MKIPFAKPYLTDDDAREVYKTILTGWVTQGPKVQEFEEKFADYVGSKYAIAVSNCTNALHLAMITSGLKQGDEVICPSLSFIATANSIMYAGAKPVFAEVDPETYNIDPASVESLISDKTKAILIVHQMGMPADIDAFKKMCGKYNLKLIEDAACALGSSYKGQKIGSHSELVCFSFHPRKTITTGEGGMITTGNEVYHNQLKLLRQHGMTIDDRKRHFAKKVIFENYIKIGYNYRMTDIQAAMGIKQLERLDWMIKERRKIAAKYNKAFRDIKCVRVSDEKEGFFSNYQSYSIYLKSNAPVSRDDLMQKMLDEGIATRRGVMTVHREIAYKNYCKRLNLPISEDISDRSIILPLYIPMKDEEVNFVIGNFRKFLNE
ncbi:MAG: aminotransferase DegT [Actinobacteria bacterium RBG_19FT_COMBO_36_27]|nr:MAG: aminotransferase DegT [Actinobacteria bacterium RBG_19FT_COMBO_36_27]